MNTETFEGSVVKIYDGVDGTISTNDRIFFVSDGSSGLIANDIYYRETTLSTPINICGSTGSVGITGATGYTGANGTMGSTGSIGHTGSTGYTGYTGATGTVGSIGSTGHTGADGSTGSIGATGSNGGNTLSQSEVGTFDINDNDNSDIVIVFNTMNIIPKQIFFTYNSTTPSSISGYSMNGVYSIGGINFCDMNYPSTSRCARASSIISSIYLVSNFTLTEHISAYVHSVSSTGFVIRNRIVPQQTTTFKWFACG